MPEFVRGFFKKSFVKQYFIRGKAIELLAQPVGAAK